MIHDLEKDSKFTHNIKDIIFSCNTSKSEFIGNKYNKEKMECAKSFKGLGGSQEILCNDNNLLISKCNKYNLNVKTIESLVQIENDMLVKAKRRNINQKIYQVIEDAIKNELELGERVDDF